MLQKAETFYAQKSDELVKQQDGSSFGEAGDVEDDDEEGTDEHEDGDDDETGPGGKNDDHMNI